MPGTHALLSASSSKRWLSCPPSAQLAALFPEETSPAAEEGTFAHAFAELKLRKMFLKMRPSAYKKRLNELIEDPHYSVGLEEYISDYVDLVAERYSEATKRCKDPVIFLEQSVDYSDYAPGGKGTADVLIISDGLMDVIDLKFGTGVPVEAQGNPQIRLYGLGALAAMDCLYDIQQVRTTIAQIRLSHVTSEEMTADDLRKWGEGYVKPRAALAAESKGDFCPGDHCESTFCPARYKCRARAEYELQLAKYNFADPALLSDEDMAEILSRATDLNKWASGVFAYAETEAVDHGAQWPGFKLVEGRSNRKYADELKVAAALEAAGFPEAAIYERKLYGITAMEKVTGKKKFAELLGDLVIKPPGKPALVPESDKRPALDSVAQAQKVFEEEK